MIDWKTYLPDNISLNSVDNHIVPFEHVFA